MDEHAALGLAPAAGAASGPPTQCVALHEALTDLAAGRASMSEFLDELACHPAGQQAAVATADVDGTRHTLVTRCIALRAAPCPAPGAVEEALLALLRRGGDAARDTPCRDLVTGHAQTPLQLAQHHGLGSLDIGDAGSIDLLLAAPAGALAAAGALSAHEERQWYERVQEALHPRRHVDDRAPPGDLGDGLLLGHRGHAAASHDLESNGVTHVLNLAPGMCGTNADLYQGRPIELLVVDAEDMQGYDLLGRHLEDTNAFIRKSLDGGGKCLVHCFAGINRSATIAIAYLISVRRMPLIAAVRHAFLARPCILWNESFIKQLVRLAAREGLLE
eukprot:TRINITY_DN64838_c0_g1_i1.p1 TRINITY_DN64838_c0_g1~~TRINITY_DN64838_c0_g1_i1.p1  ORF type:complete len:352 (+),score=105.14 TRINITY_DN64838_c0_g1_i1:60-1058(+)